MRKTILVILSILLFSIILKQVEATKISIDPLTQSAEIGDVVTVNVKIEASNLYAFQFDLSYDKDVLELSPDSTIPKEEFLGNNGEDPLFCFVLDTIDGFIDDIACTRMGDIGGISGTGILADIKFSIIGYGTSPLIIKDVKLKNPPPSLDWITDFTVENGNIKVETEECTDCDDNNPCTDDICNADLTCSNINNDANNCNDGFYCTINDRCSAGRCLSDSRPVDDGVVCTTDSCDEDKDQVLHIADNSLCDDNLYCNGVETCNIVNDCQSGIAPATDDNVDCTIDACNEENDIVTHIADNSLCLDGLWCNGAETCDINFGCLTGTAPNCDDEILCTIDSCDEGVDSTDNIGSCVYDTTGCACTTNSECDDNNACTDDICTVNLECQNTPNEKDCGEEEEKEEKKTKKGSKEECEPSWHYWYCSDWEPVVCPESKQQTRECIDVNDCEDEIITEVRMCSENKIVNLNKITGSVVNDKFSLKQQTEYLKTHLKNDDEIVDKIIEDDNKQEYNILNFLLILIMLNIILFIIYKKKSKKRKK